MILVGSTINICNGPRRNGWQVSACERVKAGERTTSPPEGRIWFLPPLWTPAFPQQVGRSTPSCKFVRPRTGCLLSRFPFYDPTLPSGGWTVVPHTHQSFPLVTRQWSKRRKVFSFFSSEKAVEVELFLPLTTSPLLTTVVLDHHPKSREASFSLFP